MLVGRRSVLAILALVTSSACGAADPLESALPPPEEKSIPSCDEVSRISAPPDAYEQTPRYVANEMPVEDVRTWAMSQPGFESIWIDRDHNGWITVAFSEDAAARQADLEREFPGAGVVAVAVDWKMTELMALQSRITSELGELEGSFGSGISEDRGVVSIHAGVLTEDRRAEIEARFAGERVCLDGIDPSSVPAPGPQPQAGDGWRLLVDEAHVGWPYRTGIATDEESLRLLMAEIGFDRPMPDVDFESEVVIWFGAVFGSSCPHIRLDDVVVDGDLVHAEIVLPDPPVACTADANPHSYLVAVDRSKLPRGPFAIQLGADGPPAGAPEERTLVDVDLSEPGTVAGPEDVRFDPSLPEPYEVESGDVLEPGFPMEPYFLSVHCGIEWLGEFNGYVWRTDAEMPSAWADLVEKGERIALTLLLSTAPVPTIEASAGSATVTYHVATEPMPGCD